MAKLLLAFTVIPLIDLFLLMRVGGLIGFWPTVTLVLVTGVVGASLARREGLRVLTQWRESLAAGRVPTEGVLGGVLVLVGGTLLVTPGVLTDLVGLSLLLPATRRLWAGVAQRRFERAVEGGTLRVTSVQSPFHGLSSVRPRMPGRIIDVPGETVDP